MKTTACLLIRILIPIAVLVGSTTRDAKAHGEDKPGPHGGYIRMPGAFHTEVVPNGRSELKIYLLDINWKNPTVADSRVDVSLDAVHAKCRATRNYFSCKFPKSVNLQAKGELTVKAQKENQKGAAVIYALPFTRPAPNADHSSH